PTTRRSSRQRSSWAENLTGPEPAGPRRKRSNRRPEKPIRASSNGESALGERGSGGAARGRGSGQGPGEGRHRTPRQDGGGEGNQERDARHQAPRQAQGLHLAAGWTQVHEDRTPREVPAIEPRLLGRPRDPFRDERAAPEGNRPRSPGAAH